LRFIPKAKNINHLILGEYMKKLLIGGMVATSMFAMQLSQAATICDVKTNLNDARSNLVAMVNSNDKAEQTSLRTKVNDATTKLEGAYTAMLGDDNKADDAELGKFKTTWEAFKNTRETEIIPAVEKGDTDTAKKIAQGIQAQRMKTMNGVVEKLGGNDCK